MAKRSRQRVWMRVPCKEDVARLRELLIAQDARWERCEYKLLGDRVIISLPVAACDSDSGDLGSGSRPPMKIYRIVPDVGGPFRLEFMRHTGRWWPMADASGKIEALADIIARDGSWVHSLLDSEA